MLQAQSKVPESVTSPSVSDQPFSAFPLAAPLARGLQDAGFGTATEIQARSLPISLAGRDLMASAQTGTGKTAAFVLPALQKLLTPSKRQGRGPRVLILTPTRELAAQVESVVRVLGRHTKLRFGMIVGGVSMGPQQRLLRAPLDVLVATPGRLMDHMSSGGVDFSRLELFILDEADRMLDMGFVRPVKKIAAALPAERQTLLFSATLEGAVNEIARGLLRNPERIQLATARKRHEGITQRLHMAQDTEHKHAMLAHLLGDPEMERAIVFISTKRGADKLAKRLNASGFACAALHGNMKQNARTRTVDLLRRGTVNILVATDVAARGIDLTGISHVINFHLPMVAEDYIHRIGRTGRNGANGIAISLVDAEDRAKLSMIERLTGSRLERLEPAGFSWTRPARPAAAATADDYRPRDPRRRAGSRPNAQPGAPKRGTAPQRSGQRPHGRPGHHADGSVSGAGNRAAAARTDGRGQRSEGRADGNRAPATPSRSSVTYRGVHSRGRTSRPI